MTGGLAAGAASNPGPITIGSVVAGALWWATTLVLVTQTISEASKDRRAEKIEERHARMEQRHGLSDRISGAIETMLREVEEQAKRSASDN